MKHRWLVCVARDSAMYTNKSVTEVMQKQGNILEFALIRITANMFEVGPAGSLIFYGDRKSAYEIVQVIAPGQWTSVTPDHVEGK